ncbi:MAG: AAA family ATPase [Candidatus Hodarchaeales archaeon]|jgi:BioD-like phosphotransacetylase family protein
MNKIIVASTRKEAGKTSIIIGLAKAISNKEFSYMKPLGDHLLYKEKRLWDYDSELVINVLGLSDNPENVSLGFAHSKLRYMYDETSTKDKINEIIRNVSKNKDFVLIEGSDTIQYGLSVYLDPLTIARNTGAKLLLVLSGPDECIIDDITFLKNCVITEDINLIGVIINKIKDVDEFKKLYLDIFSDLGVNVLGIIPHRPELTYFTMEYLNHILNAKVLAGENGLKNRIERIFVGAMSAAQVIKKPLWNLENKLIITPGDRLDMLVAALDSSTAGIVLTNNILPEDPVIESRANIKKIPLLLVPKDTFAVAKEIDDMEILFTKDETDKISLLEELIKKHVDLSKF